jgi:catechol 2,3-dioxygenase-like lactoylglutathione lyase family enzyme
MKLDGIHHITAITRDARENLDFYAGVLGLRLTGKAATKTTLPTTTSTTATRSGARAPA